jgi:hypothetical protein
LDSTPAVGGPGTGETDAFVSGRWIELIDGRAGGNERPLAERDDLVLAVAERRGADPAAVAAAFERMDGLFDADAVYLAPGPE